MASVTDIFDVLKIGINAEVMAITNDIRSMAKTESQGQEVMASCIFMR
jgi:hypothetical protein